MLAAISRSADISEFELDTIPHMTKRPGDHHFYTAAFPSAQINEAGQTEMPRYKSDGHRIILTYAYFKAELC